MRLKVSRLFKKKNSKENAQKHHIFTLILLLTLKESEILGTFSIKIVIRGNFVKFKNPINVLVSISSTGMLSLPAVLYIKQSKLDMYEE